MNLAFNQNIPLGSNNPSNDRPLMTENFNSTFTWPTIDHFGFQDNSGGFHKKVTFPSTTYTLASPPIPASSQMILFSALTTSPVASVLSYTSDTNPVPIQLTAPFRPLTTTGSVGSGTFSSSATFLPGLATAGAFIIQFGYVTAPNRSTAISFPITFTTLLSLNVSIKVAGASPTSFNDISVRDQSNSGFSWGSTNSYSGSTGNVLSWTAIGV